MNNKKNALLIGGTGFVGCHMQNLLYPEYNVKTTGSNFDIQDISVISDLVHESRPDIVINFASITTVKESFDNPLDTYNIGFFGTLNLLTSLKQNGFKGKMLNISSSEVYGHPDKDQLPISEDAQLYPMSPYAVCKIATETLCYQWSRTEPFIIITARPFTHIGPGQSDRFSISNFSKQIAEILNGKREPVIYVGDINTTRDLTDVRDVVRAYKELLLKGTSGNTYNVCSGKEARISFILDVLIRFSKMNIRIETDQSALRRNEQQFVVGNNSKICKEVMWKPIIPIDKTLSDILEYWTQKIKTEN